MILGIIDKYFTVAEDLYRIRILSKNNIQRFLMLLYFPLILSSLILTQPNLSPLVILTLVIFSFILIIPSIYYFTFFFYRNFNSNIKSFQFEKGVDNLSTANRIDFKPWKTNDIDNTFIFKLFDRNATFYKPKKIKSKKVIDKLRVFYNEKSNDYFDKYDYEFDYFIDLIFKNKSLTLNERIKLDSELKGSSIKLLLKELKQITEIYQSELAKLFYIETKSDGFKNININSINSAYSQLDIDEKS